MPDDTSLRAPRPSGGASCPICGRPAAATHKPFCSRRCADIDLNRWLSGVYRVPTEERPTDGGGADQD